MLPSTVFTNLFLLLGRHSHVEWACSWLQCHQSRPRGMTSPSSPLSLLGPYGWSETLLELFSPCIGLSKTGYHAVSLASSISSSPARSPAAGERAIKWRPQTGTLASMSNVSLRTLQTCVPNWSPFRSSASLGDHYTLKKMVPSISRLSHPHERIHPSTQWHSIHIECFWLLFGPCSSSIDFMLMLVLVLWIIRWA